MTKKLSHPIFTAGVDEVGRGALAGPVYAAAVILDPAAPIVGLADSKLLRVAQRERLSLIIQERALAWAVGVASVEEIEQHNILQASLLAMQRAVEKLIPSPVLALVDGNQAPSLACAVQTIIKGDQTEPAISAASILAKVARDTLMQALDAKYPHYGFADHKGYGTKKHLAALSTHGACPIHRRTYAPIQALSLITL